MNFIFQSYPAHPWIADWTFEPGGCNTAYRENCRDHFFRSQQTVGVVVPHADSPEWALHIPVPQNIRINLLNNGFCAYLEQRKLKFGAEVLAPEPGVIWGRFTGIPAPALLSENTIEKYDNRQWVETDTLNALLEVRDHTFCLISKARVLADAEQVAEAYFNRDLEEELSRELGRRSGAVALFEDMAHHDSLAVICVESMRKALRPAEGKIPHMWSQSSSAEMPRFDLNEFFPLAMAWSLVDIETAEELVLCALKIQTNAGALPVSFSPQATFSTLEAAKPMLAKTVEKIWEIRKDPEFLATILPMLRRHVQWLLHHFDPKRRGTYSWKSQNETIIPSLYETDLASVDLAVLLLTEIEALNQLQRHSAQYASHAPFFDEEKTNLEHSIVGQFWNDAESAFSNAFIRDVSATLHGFPELTPLLWKDLPNTQKSAILERIKASEKLPGKLTALSWRQSSLEDQAFPLLQQFLLLMALKTADPHGTLLSDFSRLTIQGFVEWHTVSLESNNTLQINPGIAAYIMNVQAIHKYRHHATGTVTGRLFKFLRKVRADRTDLMVIAATAIVLFCVHVFYNMKESPPPLTVLQAQMNSAYADKNAEMTLKSCSAIIDNYPQHAGRARLLAANILMLNGKYKKAADFLSEVRKEYPDSPGPMISLGLAHQLQGQFKEAETNYYEFCYLFDEIFPNVVKEVDQYRYLMQEGFRTPPKWQEIYRYQFMHELQ